jgi:hypothetical protein
MIWASSRALLDRGLFFARVEAASSYCVAARIRRSLPEGMLITAGEPTRSVRGFRDGDDAWLLVGGEGHITGSDAAQPERCARLEAFARRHFDVTDVLYRRRADGRPRRRRWRR